VEFTFESRTERLKPKDALPHSPHGGQTQSESHKPAGPIAPGRGRLASPRRSRRAPVALAPRSPGQHPKYLFRLVTHLTTRRAGCRCGMILEPALGTISLGGSTRDPEIAVLLLTPRKILWWPGGTECEAGDHM
jgi:hypothetical protein